jgi:hypothetical protein
LLLSLLDWAENQDRLEATLMSLGWVWLGIVIVTGLAELSWPENQERPKAMLTLLGWAGLFIVILQDRPEILLQPEAMSMSPGCAGALTVVRSSS